MKQKIVMKVHMCCDKCRTKALKVAAVAQGVSLVELQGDEKDQVVVIGDCVDTEKLVRSIRKKTGNARIVTVEKVKDKDKEKEKEKKEEEERRKLLETLWGDPWAFHHQYYPSVPVYGVVHDPCCSGGGCSIM